MTTSLLRLPLLAVSLVALVVTGCGARTVLRDTDDGGVTPDKPGVDVPPIDVPFPPPIDVPFPPPIDVPVPPPIDVPVPPPIDVPVPPPIDVPVPPPIDVPVPPPIDVPVPPPLDRPVPSSTCAGATPVGDRTILAGQDTSGIVGTAPACAPVSFISGAPLWYRIVVPPRQTLTATAVSDGGMRPPAVRLYDSCGAMACLNGSVTAADGRTVSVRSSNGGDAPTEVFIAVSGFGVGQPARFTLQTSLAGSPTNVTCARATPVLDGTSLSAQDPSTAVETQPPCPGMSGVPTLPVLFYTAVVPPGMTLFATAAPEGPARTQTFVRVIPDCGATVCLASSTPTSGVATATWFNAGRTEQRVVVTLGSNPAGTGDRSTMTFRIRAPATNARCESATRVTNGAVLRAESLADARAIAPWCNLGRSASALYYAVRVGPGEVLTARGTNTGGGFPVPTLRLGSGCASTTCLATSTNLGGAAPSGQLTYLNSSTVAQELVLAADAGGLAVPAFRFDLAVSIGLPPYTVSRIATACDPLAGGAVIGAAIGDDVGSAAIPLPIRFAYFGTPMSSWSVSTNGYLQLWPTLSGMSAGALGSAVLPSGTAPGSMVAPFWDDLEVRAAEGMDVRWQTVEAPARHVTTQWTNVGFCCGGGSPDRLTFQVKLFELTGVIEFHYCDLRGSDRVRGANASIGLQDANGLLGLSILNRAAALDPMTAFRLTPSR